MKKYSLILLLILTFIVTYAAVVWAAGTTVTLNLSNAPVGATVTATGQSDPNTAIATKVVDGNGNIVLLDFVKSGTDGAYSCAFKVPAAANGILKVVAGYGTNVAVADLAATYTVTFNKNGGNTEANPTTKTVTAGGNVGALPTPPARAGYTFTGWNTQTDGNGTSFTTTTTVTANITVYAQWTLFPTYSIAAISNQTLTTLNAGYASGAQETKIITITRTGSGDLTNLATALSGSGANNFIISQPAVTTLNSGTPATTFTVKAKNGLAAGNYTATVTVSATNMVNMSFTITQQVNNPGLPTVAAPVIKPAGGTYNTAQAVTITCATDGAAIYYTTDGSDPTQLSALYSGIPVSITGTTTLKAKAFLTGWNPSNIASQAYTINGTIISCQPGNNDPASSPNKLLTAQNIEGDLSVQYNSATLRLGKGLTGKLSDVWLYYPKLFGTGSSQIPAGSKIVSAELVLTVKDFTGNIYQPHQIDLYQISDPNNLGAPCFGSDGLRNGLDFQYRDHRPGMNIPWKTGSNTTIDTLLSGNTPVDTYAAIPAIFTADGYTQIRLDVTSSLQSWLANPTLNQGWFLKGDQAVNWGYGDGIEFYGAGDATVTHRPKLVVTYLSSGGDNTPPAMVSKLQATPGSGQVTLSWTNPSDSDFNGVLILRKAGVAPADPTDGTVVYDGIATNTQDQGLDNGKTYYYAVFAYDNLRNYSKKSWVQAIPQAGTGTKPSDPSGLTVNLSGNTLSFSWSDNSSNEDWFVIEQKEGTGSFALLVTAGANQTSLTVKIDDPNFSLQPGTTYQYRIKAVNAYGDSGYDAALSSITTSAFPAAPTNLSWTIISAGRVNLNWTDEAVNETGYRIDICQNDSAKTVLWSINLPADSSSCSVTGLSPGTEYLFKVVAMNALGESAAWTEPITTTADFKGGLL
jgi:uncharacterized repeat protein (TIGR02543 family)